MQEEDCLKVVDWIDQVLSEPENEAHIQHIGKEVNAFMEQFPLYSKTPVA